MITQIYYNFYFPRWLIYPTLSLLMPVSTIELVFIASPDLVDTGLLCVWYLAFITLWSIDWLVNVIPWCTMFGTNGSLQYTFHTFYTVKYWLSVYAVCISVCANFHTVVMIIVFHGPVENEVIMYLIHCGHHMLWSIDRLTDAIPWCSMFGTNGSLPYMYYILSTVKFRSSVIADSRVCTSARVSPYLLYYVVSPGLVVALYANDIAS